MNVKELENILNSNRLDLRQLNSVQRLFIDKLQKKGIIETKPLDTLEKEQLEAREEVAKEKNLYADPIKAMTADKLNRNKVATYTDIGLLMAQLLMDRKRLAQLFLNPSKGAQELAKIKSTFKNPTLNKFVTGLKQIGAMTKGKGGLAASQALRSVTAGTTGYVGGALAYDTADEIVRDLMDLKGKVGDKTYKEMMGNNQLVRSLDDLRYGLTFNAGAELLGPLMSGSAYLLRRGFGLETEYSRALANIAKTNNLDATYIMLADPKTVGGKVLKTINRVFGQLPIVGGPAAKAQLDAINKFNQMSQKAFNIAPGMHLATAAAASEKAGNQILKRYEKFRQMNDINYNRAIDLAKSFGDPRFIDLTEVGKLLRAMERDALTPPEVKLAFTQVEALKTPLGNFIDSYKKLVGANRPISITEYIELRKLLNQSTSQMFKNDPQVAIYTKLQTALEQDFARANLDVGREISLRFPVQNLDVITKTGDAVQAEVKSTMGQTGLGGNEKKQIKEAIEDAFSFYANNVKTFESRTARIASKFDENALSLKQIQGFVDAGSLEKDQILKTLSRNILQLKSGFSFDAVTDLQKLLDADVYKVKAITDPSGATIYKPELVKRGSKEGNKTLEDLWGAHVGDAYQLSFREIEKDNFQTWIKQLLSRESAQAQSSGIYKNLDELQGPNGLPIRNIEKGNLRFEPDIFRKLVLPNEAAATQFRIIFGPQKANKMLKQYDELLTYMDSVKSYVVPDPSTFLARRLVLTGGATGSFYGMGVLPTFIMLLMGRYANKILSNPKAMDVINGEFKNFLEAPGKYGAFSTQTRFSLAKLGNYFLRPETGKEYDASDISMMDMHEFFRNSNTPVTSLKDLNMEKEESDNLYPPMTNDEYLASLNDLPPPDDLFARIGGMPANQEEEQMMTAALNQLPDDAPITPTTLPRQQGLRIPGPGVTPIDYSALFPFDPVGNLIASRKGPRNA